MCTCITYKNGEFYFGRNMDLEYTFGEKVVITPRNYKLVFQKAPDMESHYAMIGMSSVQREYPLYAEAVNEKGLCMAGLNFPGSAFYREARRGKDNIAPYELIPWLLGQCASAEEARSLLKRINILNIPFSEYIPNAPLHWMIADQDACLVLEAVENGICVYDDPYGVLTNNPPFPYYMSHLSNYRNLTGKTPQNQFSQALTLPVYGQGLGAVGLPGDFSPASRFVRAAFLKWNSQSDKKEEDNVAQVFHILDGVAMVRGAVVTEDGQMDITTYSCCINAKKGIYYYKTYGNSQLQAVSLDRGELDRGTLKVFELIREQRVNYLNSAG